MRCQATNSSKHKVRLAAIVFAGAFVVFTASAMFRVVRAQERGLSVDIIAGKNGGTYSANEGIELRINGTATEDAIGVILNDMDISGLFTRVEDRLKFSPSVFPLPAGRNRLLIYTISRTGEWRLIREAEITVAEPAVPNPQGDLSAWEFTPTLSVNFKGESNVNFFPPASRPERLAFADTAMQAGLQMKVTKRGWTFGGQFDLAGSSRKNEALRFGELGNRASSVDLSSYRLEMSKGRFRVDLGHISFGTNRHLVNGFSSRGLGITVPIGDQNELSFSAMNGTSIVGFDNFTGLSRADHQVLGTTFAREFVRERPGAFRIEVTALRGSLLPLDSFNQRTINDAEKSYGGAFRFQVKDKSERLRIEGGYAASRFTNRADPFLEQGLTLTVIRPVTRDARYFEASFDILKAKKLFDDRQLNLTGTFRHEEIEPLYRSIAASNQADRQNNQFEFTAGFGDLSFTYGNLRENDNLDDIASILKTLTRRQNVIFSFSPGTIFTPANPIKFVPRLAYTYENLHQFGAGLPIGGQFTSLSHVPDQENHVHGLGAELPITGKIRFSYRFNHVFQDNKQPGRETADFRSSLNSFNVSIDHFENVQIGFELSRESQTSVESSSTDRQWRFGTNLNWQDLVLKNLSFSTNFSATVAGDIANINDSRNLEFDTQFAYRVALGKKKYRKMEAQFFIRYSNRYGSRIDRLFALRDINRFQGFNAGLTINFF